MGSLGALCTRAENRVAFLRSELWRYIKKRRSKRTMIYELRTYTLKQGTLPDVVKAAGTVGRDIRQDDYGKLEGYWQTEIGPLNQVMHLWSYRDLNHRAQLRVELGKNPRWA